MIDGYRCPRHLCLDAPESPANTTGVRGQWRAEPCRLSGCEPANGKDEEAALSVKPKADDKEPVPKPEGKAEAEAEPEPVAEAEAEPDAGP